MPLQSQITKRIDPAGITIERATAIPNQSVADGARTGIRHDKLQRAWTPNDAVCERTLNAGTLRPKRTERRAADTTIYQRGTTRKQHCGCRIDVGRCDHCRERSATNKLAVLYSSWSGHDNRRARLSVVCKASHVVHHTPPNGDTRIVD